MTETVQLRARYRYANARVRDDAVIAAVGVMSDASLRCAITLGSVGTVDVEFEVPLFAECDYAMFALLERGCIESCVQKLQ